MNLLKWNLPSVVGISNSTLNGLIEIEKSQGAFFQRLPFPIESLSSFHVIQFVNRTLIPNNVIGGLGVDTSEVRAYRKSVFEYFERKAVIQFGEKFHFDSTNGVAAHRYKAIAYQSAKNEMLERDALFRHWYSGTPFETDSNGYRKISKEIVNDLKKLGYKIVVAKTYLGYLTTTLVFLIHEESGGFVIGISNGRGRVGNIQKALMEAVVNLFFGHEGVDIQHWKERIRQNGVQSLGDHRAYWLYLNRFPEKMITHEPIESADIKSMPKLKLKFQTSVLSSDPVSVVGVKCEKLIPFYVGKPDAGFYKLLNEKGIEKIEENQLIHPIP